MGILLAIAVWYCHCLGLALSGLVLLMDLMVAAECALDGGVCWSQPCSSGSHADFGACMAVLIGTRIELGLPTFVLSAHHSICFGCDMVFNIGIWCIAIMGTMDWL